MTAFSANKVHWASPSILFTVAVVLPHVLFCQDTSIQHVLDDNVLQVPRRRSVVSACVLFQHFVQPWWQWHHFSGLVPRSFRLCWCYWWHVWFRFLCVLLAPHVTIVTPRIGRINPFYSIAYCHLIIRNMSNKYFFLPTVDL